MGRKILFVTTDQQRYDTLGCNGGTLARTPVVDGARRRTASATSARIPQSVVCMPSRSTILTGQHPSTHGVWMNGVPLPVDAPSVAAVLHDTATAPRSIGKAHFEPFLDPFARFTENRCRSTATGPSTGGRTAASSTSSSATHGAAGPAALRALAWREPPRGGRRCSTRCSTRRCKVNAAGGGDTGAPQVHDNPIPREWYHTDWVADRTIAWLDSLGADDDWFCWMSFPDPHHPWDPPAVGAGPRRLARRSAAGRLPGRSRPSARRILDAKPRHWRLWYDGTLVSNYEAPTRLGAGHAHRRPGPRGQRAATRSSAS